jgi:thiamine biosynthesis protein ThiS
MMIEVQNMKIPWKRGMTVSDLLDDLDDPYPYAVVKIDGRIVCRPEFDTTPVPDGSKINLVPLVAGW